MSTSVTIKTSYGSCTVENVGDDLDLHDMMYLVVVPALLGVGYSEQAINRWTSDCKREHKDD